MRMSCFDVSVDHPHADIVHYFHVGMPLQRDEVSAGCTGASRKTTRRAGLFCAVVNIIVWNYMQSIFRNLLACIATMVVVKRDSTL